jgi:hypothetical protein
MASITRKSVLTLAINFVIILFYIPRIRGRRLGGVVVTVLATGPEGFGFKTRQRRLTFKGDNNPQHTFLSDGK